jgi:hypothetical protein
LGGVATTQPRLATLVHEVKERDDIVAFPPPGQLRIAVLGWNAAAVDVLWASLLVQYGTHFQEKRDFLEIPRYVDAILDLEPDYYPLYKYVDTMLAYRPMQGTEADARLARAYLERGTREMPSDPRIWRRYGQFIAFIGPSFLHDEADKAAWRKDGAEALGHSVELGADPDNAITAYAMLTHAGATKEALRYLENAYAFTSHPSMHEIHEAIARKLQELAAVTQRDAADAADRAIDARWGHELPTVPRATYLALGPLVDPARCAGPSATLDPACARSWSEVMAEPESSADSP